MGVANSDELRRSAAVEVFLALKDTDEFKIRQKMIEKELEKTALKNQITKKNLEANAGVTSLKNLESNDGSLLLKICPN